jgi:PAS domain S-box-containing protein
MKETEKTALRVTLVYAVIATLWIIFSGRFLAFFVNDPSRYISLEVYKGLGFVAVTSILLYMGMRHQFGRMEQMHRDRLDEVARKENILYRLEHYLKVSPTVTWAGKIEHGKVQPVWFSKNLEQLFGYSLAEALKPGWWQENVHPEDRLKIENDIALLAERGSLGREYRFYRKDGSVIWIREEIRTAGHEKHPGDIVGTWTIITKQKEAELSLAESEQRYRSLFKSAPVAVFVNHNDRVVMANRACMELFEAKEVGQLLGRSIYDMFHPALHEIIKKRVFLVRERKEQVPILEEKILTLSGRSVDVEVSSAPFVYEGDPALHVILRDITERKEAERKLRELNAELEQRVADRTAELESRNLELERFTYSVSHDLKAPLRGIDGYSRLLLEDHYENLDEEGREFLEIIRGASQQMSRLIDDLLDYSRMELHPMESATIDVGSLIDSVLFEKRKEIKERGADVEVSVPFETIRGDEDGLALALRNYVDNALKFTGASGTPRLTIGGEETDRSWTIWVRDNGIGFDMSFHDRIFDIFQRLHRSEDYEGTGVGLAIVKKAVERMGGRTWAESTPGEGSTFYMEIPK